MLTKPCQSIATKPWLVDDERAHVDIDVSSPKNGTVVEFKCASANIFTLRAEKAEKSEHSSGDALDRRKNFLMTRFRDQDMLSVGIHEAR